MDLLKDLEIAKDAALKAGSLVMSYFNKSIEVIEKSPNNPVTEADFKSDELLQNLLLNERPQYGWLSEETKDDGSRFEKKQIWMVDPIDGTRAFIKGLPHFSISIALIDNNEPVIGIIYNPATNEFFHAVKGHGSFKNDILLSHQGSAELLGAKMLGDANMFSSKKWPIAWPDMEISQRNSIAYRMALVASGEFDAAIATNPKNYWDVAAGTIILKEANKKITDHLGNEFHFNQQIPLLRSLVASNLNLHSEILYRLGHIV